MSVQHSPSSLRSALWARPARSLFLIWLASSLCLGAVGPFGSFIGMGFVERTAYWAIVVGASILLASALRLAALLLLGRGRHPFVIDAILTPTMVVLYSPSLYFFNEIVFGEAGIEGRQPFSLVQTGAIVFVVTLLLIVVREIFTLHAPGVQAPTAAPVPSAPPTSPMIDDDGIPLVERLPDDLRGTIRTITGADHYVEVRTERGATSILLRFSDALRELGAHPGMQVHRSHWVADCAVVGLRRERGRLLVRLTCGSEIPVSRSQQAAAQARWGGLSEGCLRP